MRATRYSVRYELNDDGSYSDSHVRVVKMLTDTPETMATLRRFAQTVMPDLRAQIIYR